MSTTKIISMLSSLQ